MSHVTQQTARVPTHAGPSRLTLGAALLALAAAGAVALAIALSGGSSPDATPAAVQAQPGLRADGGPDETSVAATLGRHGTSGPSESVVAAAIGRRSAPVARRPDESRVAAVISGR